MFFRRMLYLLFLSAAFFYYIFHTGYLAWALFAAIITLPLLSLVIALPLRQKCRVSAVCECEPGTGLFVCLRAEPALPYTSMRFRVLFENQFTGETIREKVVMSRRDCPKGKIRLRYESGVCGVIRVSVARVRVLDPLGLFCLPVRAPEPMEALLLPAELPFNGDHIDWPSTEQAHTSQKPEGITGEREYSDIRPYREGDSLRDVHWKLTARFDRPIVREYAYSTASVRTVAIRWSGDCEALCLALARLLGVIRYFASQGQYVLLFAGEERREYASPGANTLNTVLWHALSKPPSANEAGSLPDGVLLVCPDEVLLWENGKQREVASA